MKPMTVAEAIKFLSQFPGDTKLVANGSDHSYQSVWFNDGIAEIKYGGNRDRIDHMWQYNEGSMTDEKNAIERVVVIGD